MYVVKTTQDVLGAEGMGGTYSGNDFLCDCATSGNVFERHSMKGVRGRKR